ncbi:MAG: Family ership [Chloroflexota bacterium]|jgi:hypothetical protein
MTDRTALEIRTDRRLVRSVHHSTRYALVEVTAPPATSAPVRPRVNVSFVVDRSGSMASRRKLALAKEAVLAGIARLAAADRFSVVAFDEVVDVVAPGAAATSEAKDAAGRHLQPIDPRGQTALSEGWLRGAEQVAAALDPEGVNRVLLLTDGLANHGIVDPTLLERHASELRARGVITSTFGVGEDFDERLLAGMADAGGGAFRYIKGAEEIPALIGSEVGDLLEVTARGAVLHFVGGDGIEVVPLTPFPIERHPSRQSIVLGDLVADQVVRLVLALRFPLGVPGGEIGVEAVLESATGGLSGNSTLRWAFADTEANDRQARDRDVDRVVARSYADRALRDAVTLNRERRWEEARQLLRAVAQRIKGYAGRDEVLIGIVAELERESEAWSRLRHEFERKERYARSSYALKSRLMSGAPLRIGAEDEDL